MNINNPKIWSITDGSQGMKSQTRGLAKELSEEITEIETDIRFPWSRLQPGILPFNSWIFKNIFPSNVIPEIVISCGRKSVYLSLYLKKIFSNIVNIHIQDPKISPKKFSFIIAPNHDMLKGKNIINSVGALHHFSQQKFNKKKFDNNTKNLVSCIIGGENNHYLFKEKEALDLCSKIIDLKKKNLNIEILVLTSRRTSKLIKSLLKTKLQNITKLWLGDGQNPYEFALYNSSHFIITSDSTSMISEASISGKPIYIYNLPYKRNSLRFQNFHEEFKKLNITRDFLSMHNLENWSYNRLNESKRIAGIIKERIIEGNNESQ